MADEINVAQAGGEVVEPNQSVSQYVRSDIPPATFDELGLDRRRAAEWPDRAMQGRAFF